MSLYTSLSLGAQTAYAQLFDAASAAEFNRLRRKPEGVVRRENREGQEILVFPAYGRVRKTTANLRWAGFGTR